MLVFGRKTQKKSNFNPFPKKGKTNGGREVRANCCKKLIIHAPINSASLASFKGFLLHHCHIESFLLRYFPRGGKNVFFSGPQWKQIGRASSTRKIAREWAAREVFKDIDHKMNKLDSTGWVELHLKIPAQKSRFQFVELSTVWCRVHYADWTLFLCAEL